MNDQTELKLNILTAFVAAGILPQKLGKTMKDGMVFNMNLTLTFTKEERYWIIGDLEANSEVRTLLLNGDNIL